MIKAFFGSKKWALWAYGGGLLIVVLLYGQVELAVILNSWRKEFGDLLQEATKHPVDEFWALLLRFMYIVMPWVVVAMFTAYFSRLYAFRWREAMTFSYIPRLREATQKIEGESQRVQEDAKNFANIVESMGKEVVRALMTLIAFGPILWGLSIKVDLAIIKDIPGSLFWIALATSVGGTAISWLVGIKLPGLEYNNQVAEAAFRKELVLAEDDKINFGSVPTLSYLFTGIRFNYHRLFLHYGYFDLWANSYGQIMVIAAYVAMGPALFTGAIMLGTLHQVASAFDEVHSSFSIFVNNWTRITELRSIWRRLHEFEANLDLHQPKSS
ncbi:MAG: putative transporter [bacterium]|nr:putative transporter [bacterium]